MSGPVPGARPLAEPPGATPAFRTALAALEEAQRGADAAGRAYAAALRLVRDACIDAIVADPRGPLTVALVAEARYANIEATAAEAGGR